MVAYTESWFIFDVSNRRYSSNTNWSWIESLWNIGPSDFKTHRLLLYINKNNGIFEKAIDYFL